MRTQYWKLQNGEHKSEKRNCNIGKNKEKTGFKKVMKKRFQLENI